MLRLAICRDRGLRLCLVRVAVRIGRRGTNKIRTHGTAAQQRQDDGKTRASLD